MESHGKQKDRHQIHRILSHQSVLACLVRESIPRLTHVKNCQILPEDLDVGRAVLGIHLHVPWRNGIDLEIEYAAFKFTA